MKKSMKKFFAMFLVAALVLVPFVKVDAADPIVVENEQQLKDALAQEGEVYIELKNDITLTAPLYVYGNVTIDGKDFSIDGTNIVPLPEAPSNKSIITAMAGSELALTNIKLLNAPKYGVQAYNGGAVLVNGVTIQDCKFGAILVNGGALVVQDLTMIRNGSFEEGKTGNGIELGKGDDVTEDPYLVMDGTFTTQEQDTAIWVAENDRLMSEEDSKLMFGNTENSEFKLSLENNALVVKDSEGQTVASSNAVLEEITVEEDTDEPTTPEEPVQPGEENPSTSDNFMIFAGLAVIALGLGTVTFRKLCK